MVTIRYSATMLDKADVIMATTDHSDGDHARNIDEGTKVQSNLRSTKDIYSLIDHYMCKGIWEHVKMLLEGSEITKKNVNHKMYDDFETIRQNKAKHSQSILSFCQVSSMDMRIIKFVTAVKLNKGLKDSNFDQLYAYLKQHEAHANENKMMLERLTQQTVDPLALMSNGRQNRGQGNNARGAGAVGYGRAQNRVGNANPGQARRLSVQCNGVSVIVLAGGQDNAFDEDVDEQPVQDLALNVDNVFQADDCDAYDSDVDDAPTAQTLFMANLSSADPVYDEAGPSYDSDGYLRFEGVTDGMIDNDLHESDVPSVSHTPMNTVVNNLLNAELATYKEQVELVLLCEVNKVAIGYKNPLCLHGARQDQPALYSGHVIVAPNHAPAIVRDCEETLEQAEISRKRMP
ncbi:hypothetical protein Tco_0697038 [Tanacetum coccineum]